ncbi:hypothetical protein [Streptomyces silvensis]|uniref:hypothetical protein n=1 Tax=Streptomyces silvensis TaxID=1765722 RepID=UPI000ABED5AE|nr:hypothetical protein [Streptomyces silvensis]
MSEQPTAEPHPEPDRTPHPSRVLAEPATVDACHADYQAAAAIRIRITRQEGR